MARCSSADSCGALSAEVLLGAAAVPRRHGSLRVSAPLGTRVDRARTRRAAQAAGLCEAVREAREDRRRGRGGDLRGGDATDHAVRGGEDARAAGRADASQGRDLLVRQRTALVNALRAHLAGYGIGSSKGPGGVTVLMKVLHEAQERLATHARSALHTISSQLRALASEVGRLEAQDPGLAPFCCCK